jgi:DUF4097 and DUF4098 domain-containing protein YvlB
LDRETKTDLSGRYLVSLAAVVLVLIGCKGGIDKTLEQKLEEIHPLATGGSLSIKNTDGSIHIYGADAAELRLKAIKRAYSTERLNGIGVQVTARDGSAALETIFPPKPEWWRLGDRSGTVDYFLLVPQELSALNLELVNGEVTITGLRSGKVKANLENGRMSARNCFTDLDYQVTNGAADFYYNWWEQKMFFVRAATANGGIGALVPLNASFRIEAKAPNGHIKTNLVRPELDAWSQLRNLKAVIGSDPGATFHLESRSGNIRIQGF